MSLRWIFAALMISSSVAEARFLVDPYLGYLFSSMKSVANGPSNTPVDTSSTGSEFSGGARLGYKWMSGFWLAVDPQLSFSGKSSLRRR